MSALASDHRERLAACWRIQDCGRCLRSKAGCGWCPESSACIPTASLLTPLHHPVCPLPSERFELRTAALGCGCSTTTFLAIVITVLCTLVATLISYGVWRSQILQWTWRIFWQGSGEGWEIVKDEDGKVREGGWRRGRRWGIKMFSGMGDDEASLEERRKLLGGR